MDQVTVKVVKGTRGYGYSLKHNQKPGFRGIIGNTWAWYRYKKDALEAAAAFEKWYNPQPAAS
jgi:hypothetical protein